VPSIDYLTDVRIADYFSHDVECWCKDTNNYLNNQIMFHIFNIFVYYMIKDLTADEVKSLLRMIKGASLNERRDFDGLKNQIEDLVKKDLL